LHPNNFSKAEALALKRSGLGYGGVKIIREMHRKIKSALIFSFFCIKTKGRALYIEKIVICPYQQKKR